MKKKGQNKWLSIPARNRGVIPPVFTLAHTPPQADTHFSKVQIPQKDDIANQDTIVQLAILTSTNTLIQNDFSTTQIPEVDDIATQDTAIQLAIPARKLSANEQLLAKLPMFLQQITTALFEQTKNIHPEELPTNAPNTNSVFSISWFPVVALASSVGLCSVAYSFSLARASKPGLEIFFLLGLILIFAPSLVHLLSTKPSRFERVAIVCTAGINLYCIKFQSSPLHFSFFDEFLHWRTANDILQTGHLFTRNSLLPVSPYYPGIEIVTNALSALSGLNTFYSAILVIGIARLVMVLSLYMLNEQLLGSPRMAGLAAIIYMGNPHFLLFDAQYAYESLALPLTAFVLFALSPHRITSTKLEHIATTNAIMWLINVRDKLFQKGQWQSMITTLLVLGAIVVTHHVTDFFLDGLLILWTTTYAFLHLSALFRSSLARITVLGVVFSLIMAFQHGNPVVDYISSFLLIAINELGHIVSGTSSAKPLFQNYSGHPTALWERVLTITSQLLILSGLPLGLLCLWQRFRTNALAYTFGILTLCYPLVQVFRFTTAGSELVDRSAAFLFIPISTILAILIAQMWPAHRLKPIHVFSLTSTLCIMILGSIVLGSGPSMALLPGTYMVTADARSIETQGIQTATWAQTYLGPNNHIATDRINQILMGTYGNQQIITSIADHVEIAPIFLSSQLGPEQISLLKSSKTRYIVVDMRLTQALPLLGFYYEQDEEGAYRHTKPLNIMDMNKFSTSPQINKIFDNGDIIIYDAKGVINAQK